MPKKRKASMPGKKRYLVAHRHGPRLDSRSEKDLETFVSAAPEAKVVRRTPVGRRVVEMTEEQARDLATKHPQLVVEEDEDLTLFAMPGLLPRMPRGEPRQVTVTVKDAASGDPIRNATVYGEGAAIAYKGVTGADGQVSLAVQDSVLDRIVVLPREGYWSRVVPVGGEATAEVALRPLFGNGAYDWGHRLMGFRHVQPALGGKDVKVAVVDSGVAAKPEVLALSGGYNTLDGADPAAWNQDEEGHGTHVAGIIAARAQALGIVGGAPDASLYSVKVFPGGRLSDLVEGVEWCIRNDIDVVNLSLGAPSPSQVLAGALRDAYDRGIVCVAAAGNDHGPVAFPAGFATVLAVGAVGRLGTFPEDSAHALCLTPVRDWLGGLFAPRFDNFGPQVAACAPGVAIVSTVPNGFAAWDGTSMAAPFVTALCALILQAYPQLRTGDASQVEGVRSVLFSACQDLGLPPALQGRGLPSVPRALGAALAAGRMAVPA